MTAGMDAGKQVQLLGMLAKGEAPKQANLSLNSVKINSVPAFNPSLGYTPYVVPGLFLLILHQTLLIGTGILGAGHWRRKGYWRDVSPLQLGCGRISAFMSVSVFTGIRSACRQALLWWPCGCYRFYWQPALLVSP